MEARNDSSPSSPGSMETFDAFTSNVQFPVSEGNVAVMFTLSIRFPWFTRLMGTLSVPPGAAVYC